MWTPAQPRDHRPTFALLLVVLRKCGTIADDDDGSDEARFGHCALAPLHFRVGCNLARVGGCFARQGRSNTLRRFWTAKKRLNCGGGFRTRAALELLCSFTLAVRSALHRCRAYGAPEWVEWPERLASSKSS